MLIINCYKWLVVVSLFVASNSSPLMTRSNENNNGNESMTTVTHEGIDDNDKIYRNDESYSRRNLNVTNTATMVNDTVDGNFTVHTSSSSTLYVIDVDGSITIYSDEVIDYPASNVSIVRPYKQRIGRDVHNLPDLYYVTPRVNRTGQTFPEYTSNNVTYKHVDITEDIMTWGLNKNIHLTDYLENVTGAHLVINIKDRMDVTPFRYFLSPNRAILFYADNNRLHRYFRKERHSLLNLALSIDPDDHTMLQQLYYRIGNVLDSDQRLRRSFMCKIIRNLVRNRVSPIDLTLDKLERELSDAQVHEFALRQLRVDDINKLPIVEFLRRESSSTTPLPIESEILLSE